MGSESIPTRADTQTINQSWFNIFKSVLAQTLVPRNSSGDAADLAGDLGSTTYRWASAYLQKLFIGAVANAISIEEESANVVVLKIGGTARMRVTTAGVQRSTLAAMNVVYSNNQASFSTSSSSIQLVSNLDLQITTTGKPVFVFFVAPSTGGNPYVGIDNTRSAAAGATSVSQAYAEVGTFRGDPAASSATWTRIGTNYAFLSATLNVTSSAFTLVTRSIQSLGFIGVDTPAAGTQRYFCTLQVSGGTGTADIQTARLMAIEMI